MERNIERNVSGITVITFMECGMWARNFFSEELSSSKYNEIKIAVESDEINQEQKIALYIKETCH